MGWCHEFGPQIQEGCGHPMVAGEASCACPHCGVVCTGRFGGCPEVWKRGPVEVVLPTRAATLAADNDDPWARLVFEAADEAAEAADIPGESVVAVDTREPYFVEDDYAEVAWRPSEDGYRPVLSAIDVDSASEAGIDAWLGAQTSTTWEPPSETVAWPSVFATPEADPDPGGGVVDDRLPWEPAPYAGSATQQDYGSLDDHTAWYVVEDHEADDGGDENVPYHVPLAADDDAPALLHLPTPVAEPAPEPAPVIPLPVPPPVDRGPRLRDGLPPLPPLAAEGERDVVAELPPIEGLVKLSTKLEALQLDLKLLSVRLAEAPGDDAASVDSVS